MDPEGTRVNVTFAGQLGELPDPIPSTASDADIRGWVEEAIRTGGIPGVPADPRADLSAFKVDRFPASSARPWPLVSVRPSTGFGA